MSRTYTGSETDELLLRNNGAVVLLNGINHVLRTSVHHAIYPYAHDCLTAYADPQDKSTEYCRQKKRELGDDWSTDLIDSDVVVLCEVLEQLQN